MSIGYEIPDTVYTSRGHEIRGWEVVEISNWNVHGTSKDSPDMAKENMMDGARAVGGNTILHMKYYKTTGSEGNYYYTIHNFYGLVVNIAKKSPNGKYTRDDFRHINSNAKTLKAKRRLKTMFSWLIAILFAMSFSDGLFDTTSIEWVLTKLTLGRLSEGLFGITSIKWALILGVIGLAWRILIPTPDWWLQKIK